MRPRLWWARARALMSRFIHSVAANRSRRFGSSKRFFRAERCRRSATAVVELAVLLPFLVMMFLVAADFARVFYFSLTLTNCAALRPLCQRSGRGSRIALPRSPIGCSRRCHEHQPAADDHLDQRCRCIGPVVCRSHGQLFVQHGDEIPRHSQPVAARADRENVCGREYSEHELGPPLCALLPPQIDAAARQ